MKLKIVKRKGTYRVLMLDGYTDGRESWIQETPQRFFTRQAAQEHIASLFWKSFAEEAEARRGRERTT